METLNLVKTHLSEFVTLGGSWSLQSGTSGVFGGIESFTGKILGDREWVPESSSDEAGEGTWQKRFELISGGFLSGSNQFWSGTGGDFTGFGFDGINQNVEVSLEVEQSSSSADLGNSGSASSGDLGIEAWFDGSPGSGEHATDIWSFTEETLNLVKTHLSEFVTLGGSWSLQSGTSGVFGGIESFTGKILGDREWVPESSSDEAGEG